MVFIGTEGEFPTLQDSASIKLAFQLVARDTPRRPLLENRRRRRVSTPPVRQRRRMKIDSMRQVRPPIPNPPGVASHHQRLTVEIRQRPQIIVSERRDLHLHIELLRIIEQRRVSMQAVVNRSRENLQRLPTALHKSLEDIEISVAGSNGKTHVSHSRA